MKLFLPPVPPEPNSSRQFAAWVAVALAGALALLMLLSGCDHNHNHAPVTFVEPSPPVVASPVIPATVPVDGPVITSADQIPDEMILAEIEAASKGEQASANRLVVFADNYPGTGMQLRGCVNDGRDIAVHLVRSGAVTSREVRLLTDQRCTAAAMRAGIKWALADAKPGDLRIIFYSGHGAQTAEGAAGERDRLIEVWCPFDFDWSPERYISDKELYAALAAVPKGVRLVVLSDSCHAGGMDRLEITKTKRPKTVVPPPEIVARTRKAQRAALGGMIDAQFGLACRENELSADTQDSNGRPCGAFTHYFLIALRAKPALTFKQLIQSTGSRMRAEGYGDQTPQAEGGGIDRPFLQ